LIKNITVHLAILLSLLSSCSKNNSSLKDSDCNVSHDLPEIRERGKLVAVTDFNSPDYYIYKGEPMGFHYELLKSFSEYLGVSLEIVGENQTDHAFQMLESGNADILAPGIDINSAEKGNILLTAPVTESRLVLVRRRPDNRRVPARYDLNKKPFVSLSLLAGKNVYVQKGSSHAEFLSELSGRTGNSIKITEVPFTAGQLIRYVAGGDIDYMVCDENVALVSSLIYPNIDATLPLSSIRDIFWGVRKTNSGLLLQELNKWISEYRKSGAYAMLYSKYFDCSRSGVVVNNSCHSMNRGSISRFDNLIRKFSAGIRWDWRLLASLIYQESRFVPDVRSVSGAYGLMQIMPGTGKDFGIDITSSPENNMRAGILYINWLYSIFDPKIPDEDERLNFILASYNAGPGHILDAMELARKNGKDPTKWNGNVAEWLKKKSDPKYYKDSAVRFGYFRGNEAVAYVEEILTRYAQYRNIIPAGKFN
jgi:membrane-bound lytic murein transglycosylase F